jgi:hypothetical protein
MPFSRAPQYTTYSLHVNVIKSKWSQRMYDMPKMARHRRLCRITVNDSSVVLCWKNNDRYALPNERVSSCKRELVNFMIWDNATFILSSKRSAKEEPLKLYVSNCSVKMLWTSKQNDLLLLEFRSASFQTTFETLKTEEWCFCKKK